MLIQNYYYNVFLSTFQKTHCSYYDFPNNTTSTIQLRIGGGVLLPLSEDEWRTNFFRCGDECIIISLEARCARGVFDDPSPFVLVPSFLRFPSLRFPSLLSRSFHRAMLSPISSMIIDVFLYSFSLSPSKSSPALLYAPSAIMHASLKLFRTSR